MDSEDQPSTSKKAKESRRIYNTHQRNMYPVSFEEFQKFANLEEYVLKEMELSGPEIYRINYKIRHKYYPTVYKQFYESESARKKMLRRGLTLKPIPKFLKDKIMQLPGAEEKEKTQKSESKHRSTQGTSKKILSSTAVSKYQKKQICKHKVASKRLKTPLKLVSKGHEKRDKNAATESQRITNFFSSLKLARKVNDVNDSQVKQNARKRKPESHFESADQIKRPRDDDSCAIENCTDAQNKENTHVNRSFNNNIKLNIDAKETVDSDPQKAKKNPNAKSPKPHFLKRSSKSTPDLDRRKGSKKKLKTFGRKRIENSSSEFLTDDSDIGQNSIELVNLTDSKSIERLCDSKSTSEGHNQTSPKSPLPRRNRNEEFKKPITLSTHKRRSESREKAEPHEQIRLSSSDTELPLLSLSGLSTVKVVFSASNIHDWLDKGINALEDDGDDDVEQTKVEFYPENFFAVERLKAIKFFPLQLKKYIKYLLNLEIQKRKAANYSTSVITQRTTKSMLVKAFMEMTFEDYKTLVNAEKLFAHSLPTESIMTDLRKQYEAIMSKENPWPIGVHVKLAALRKFLQSKRLKDPIQLKDIPPRILCFEEVLEYTNLKECTSLSREKPPESFKCLLDMCRKDFLQCCKEGFWMEGIKFSRTSNAGDASINVSNLSNLFAVKSTPSPRAHSSESITPQALSRVDDASAKSNEVNEKVDTALQESIDIIFKELGKIVSVDSVENPVKELATVECNDNREIADKAFSDQCKIEKCLDDIFSGVQEHPSKSNNDLTLLSSNSYDITRILASNTSQSAEQQETQNTTCASHCTGIVPNSEEQQETQKTTCGSHCTGIVPNSEEPLNNTIHFDMVGRTLSGSIFEDEHSQKQSDVIPPSLNLFPSSGETEHSERSQVGPPETLFVSCNHSVNFNTQERNLTMMNVDEGTDNRDPFAETNVHQEKETVAQRIDGNISHVIVKQEPCSIIEDTQKSPSPDDSVQILDLPPSEPILVEDEETTPELLDMLLSAAPQPNKNSKQIYFAENLTSLPSFSSLENFHQAQQLPSDFTFEQSSQMNPTPSHDRSVLQIEETDTNNKTAEANTAANSSTRSNSIDFLKTEICTQEEGESSFIYANMDYFMTILKTDTQEWSSISRLKSLTCMPDVRSDNENQISTKQRPGLESSEKNVDPSQSNSSRLNISRDENRLPKETLSSAATSPKANSVNIASQNISSRLELMQSCSNKSSNQSAQAEESKSGGAPKSRLSTSNAISTNDCKTVETAAVSQASKGASKKPKSPHKTKGKQNLRDTEKADSLRSESQSLAKEAIRSKILIASTPSSRKPLKIAGNQIDGGEIFKKCQQISNRIELTHDAEIVDVEAAMDVIPGKALPDAIKDTSKILSQVAVEINKVNHETDVLTEKVVQESEKTSKNTSEVVEINSSLCHHRNSSATKAFILEDSCPKNTVHQLETLDLATEDSAIQQMRDMDREMIINTINQAKNKHSLKTQELKNVAQAPSSIMCNQQPSQFIKENTYSVPAWLPLTKIQEYKNDPIESATTAEGLDGASDGDSLVEVPFLISRRFMKFLPFCTVSPQEIARVKNESVIYAINARLEFNLEEQSTSTGIPGKTPLTSHLEDQLSPPIERCQFDENVIEEWLGDATIRQRNVQTIDNQQNQPARVDELRSVTDGSNCFVDHAYSECAKGCAKKNQPKVQSGKVRKKTCASPKKKQLTKKLLKNPLDSDYIPQRSHAFRSLPLAPNKRPPTSSNIQSAASSSLGTLDEIPKADNLIKDGCQAASSTASQILGTDCTYFENSILLRKLDEPYANSGHQPPAEEQQKHSSEPKI